MIVNPYTRWSGRNGRGVCRVPDSCADGSLQPTVGQRAFTLAELLVSIFVLALIILLIAQLMTSATTVTRTGHKQIDTDTQARAVLDRMALDFAQMVNRTDVDYYVKQRSGYNGHGNGHGWGQGHHGDLGSDQIAFFTQVPGYYPSAWGSPVALVAYRVNESDPTNAAYGKLERMGKGLLWNGVNNTTTSNSPYPIVFSPGQIAGCTSGNCPCPATTGPWAGPWSAAICNDNRSASVDSDYEVIGPGVFRFEYYYLLKNGRVTDWPWDRWDFPNQISIFNPQKIGLTEVEAIAVTIAVIDPAGRALVNAVSPGRILDIAADMADFRSARGRGVGGQRIGDLEAQWQGVIESISQTGQTPSGLSVPSEAAKMIRVYNRYFNLKSL